MTDRCECGHPYHEGRCKMGVRPGGRPMPQDGRDVTLMQCPCTAFVPTASGEGERYTDRGDPHGLDEAQAFVRTHDLDTGLVNPLAGLLDDTYDAGRDSVEGLPTDVVEGVKENIVASLNTARDQVENVLLSDYERIHMGDIVRRLEAVLALLPEGGERMLTDNQIRAATRGGKLGLVAVEDGDGFKEMTNVEYLGGEVLRVREELRRYYNIEIELKERLTAIEALPEKWEAQAVNEDTARTEAADNYAAACRVCARELEQAVKGEG